MKYLRHNKINSFSDGVKRLLPFLVFFIILSSSITPLAKADHCGGAALGHPGDSGFPCPTETTGFTPLVGIPYVDTQDPNISLAGYVDALYMAAISIAAFMAVVKIIFAGVKYMLSDVVTDKGAAKKDIRGALIGLLIVIGAVLILNTINPQLKGLAALDGPPVNVRLETQNGLALDINGTHVLNPTGGEAEAERVRNFIAACGAAERTFLMRNGVISCPQPLTEESIINLPADTTLPIEDQENALIAEYESQGLEDLIGFTVDVILSDEAEVEIVRSRCQGSGGSEMILLTHTVDGVEYGRLMCFG